MNGRLVVDSRFLPALLLLLLSAPDARACGAFCDMPGDRGGVAHYSEHAPACESACDRSAGCMGWTWVKPGVQGPQGVCWIKSQLSGATVRSDCCISGYRGDRTAAASMSQFGAGAGRPPQKGIGGTPGLLTQCECADENGRPYNGILGQGCGVSFSMRNYDCRR